MNNLLEIRDLEVGIEDKTILNGVDLEIKPGEIHVLMGQNGVGKSTLVSALMGDPKYEISGGQIILDGEDITYKKEYLRRQVIAHLFQDPLL